MNLQILKISLVTEQSTILLSESLIVDRNCQFSNQCISDLNSVYQAIHPELLTKNLYIMYIINNKVVTVHGNTGISARSSL